MSASLTVSAYVFLTVFTVLCAVVFACRALAGSKRKPVGGGCQNNRTRIARQHLALLRLRHNSNARPKSPPEEYLAPPPIPQNQFTYMQAADYLHNPRSPYPISPPQPRHRDER